jgi:hypothetical protein
MPSFAGKELRLESYCSCCLAPITLLIRDGEIVGGATDSVRIHVSLHPNDFGIPTVMPMCDSMNYVIDVDHALTYERKIDRRGILLTIEQARSLVRLVGDVRMHDYHWRVAPLTVDAVITNFRLGGVELSNWNVGVAD